MRNKNNKLNHATSSKENVKSETHVENKYMK